MSIALALFGSVLGFDLYDDYIKTYKSEHDRLLVQARIANDNLTSQLKTTNLALQRIRGDLPLWSYGDRYRLEAIRQMETFAASISGIRTLLFMDAQGMVRVSNRSELMNRNLSFRNHFQIPKQHPNDDLLYLSPPFQSALSVFVMNLSRVVTTTNNGEFAGLVTASLEPEYFKTLMASILYAPDMRASIIHGDGQPFLRVPEQDESDKPNQEKPDLSFAWHLNSGKQSSIRTGWDDETGEERIIAFYTIQPNVFLMDKPLVIKISRQLDVLYSEVYEGARIYGSLFLVLVAFTSITLLVMQTRTKRFNDQSKRNLLALKESEQRLQDILNHTTAVVFMKDLESRYLFINRQYETLHHVTNHAVQGKSDHDLFPAEVAQHLHANDRSALSSTTSIMVEERIPLDDGMHTFLSIKFPLFDSNKQPYAVCCIATDITDRKQIEEQLQISMAAADAANRAKSDFLSTMSHEIRTPMNGVLGMAELLLDMSLPEKAKNHVLAIRNSGRSLLGIIDDILDLSKIESGKIELEQTSFSLHELLENLSDFFLPSILERGILFQKRFSHNLPTTIQGDPTRLRQILTNLLSNAIKFTKEGEVTLQVKPLTLEATHCRLVFEIQDTGIGIQADNFAKLFQSFEQADSSTTRRFGGTGLGLAITHRLVTLLQGEILVKSIHGQGSLFTTILPFARPKQSIPKKKSLTQDRTGTIPHGKRLLIVEDDATNRAVLHGFLKPYAMTCDFSENGRQALEKLETNRYDLIFMDCQMPELDGFATTRTFRQQGGKTTIVALTAYALKGDRERCLAAGMDDYLTKPIDRQQLCATLARWLSPTPAVATLPMATTAPPPPSPLPSPPPSPPTDTAIQTEVLSALKRDLDEEDLVNIVTLYLNKLPSRVEEIQIGFHNNDPEAVIRIAHPFKSSSRQLGAMKLGALCEKLEFMGRSGQLDPNEISLDTLAHEAEAAQKALRTLVEKD